jgi:DNA polymerase-3 subunit delta'
LASGRLSHGLLLCGEKGMGVNEFAWLLAADIIGTDDVQSLKDGKNPLVQSVRGEGASGLIRVDRIRQLNENVSYSSISGEKRVVIIHNCENFNANSANALLKNLEEPKNDTTYILTTNNPRAIMATIRSRCGVYTLSAPSKEEVAAYFLRKKADMSAVNSLMDIYGENIGKIENALNSEKRYGILQNAVAVFNMIRTKDTYGIAKSCYVYVKAKDDFRLFLDDLRDICHRNLSDSSVKAIEVIHKYRGLMETNVNLNLALENFAVEISR